MSGAPATALITTSVARLPPTSDALTTSLLVRAGSWTSARATPPLSVLAVSTGKVPSPDVTAKCTRESVSGTPPSSEARTSSWMVDPARAERVSPPTGESDGRRVAASSGTDGATTGASASSRVKERLW